MAVFGINMSTVNAKGTAKFVDRGGLLPIILKESVQNVGGNIDEVTENIQS